VSDPRLVLHSVPFSHPVLAVSTALDHLGLEYEVGDIPFGKQAEEVEAIYGEGRRTVPGLLVDDEPVHGSVAIFNRLESLVPDAGLYPEPRATAIREAEAGLAQEVQQSARVLIFGSLHFRPDAMGTFAGAPALDPSGVDFAIRSVRGAWKYLGISAELIYATAPGAARPVRCNRRPRRRGRAGGRPTDRGRLPVRLFAAVAERDRRRAAVALRSSRAGRRRGMVRAAYGRRPGRCPACGLGLGGPVLASDCRRASLRIRRR
jgi:glutaredoxin